MEERFVVKVLLAALSLVYLLELLIHWSKWNEGDKRKRKLPSDLLEVDLGILVGGLKI